MLSFAVFKRLPLPQSCVRSGARFAVVVLSPVAATFALGQVTPAVEEPPAGTAVLLSPFEVSTSKDRGYEAGETLSGTRLSTPSKFVGAAVTEVTAALMQDLALTNMQDLVNFVPNSASYFGGGLGGDSTGNNALFGVSYYVRGNLVTSASRDFIKYRVYEDAYNVERFSFSRGPNSILFGIGDPAGIVNSVSKRAHYKNAYNVGFRFDTNESSRGTFDFNQQLWPKRLAVRVAGLHENKETDRKPSDRRADRIYGALTANPFRSTTVRVSWENGHYDALNVRPWPAADGITPWIQAGRPEIPANLRNGAINNAAGTPATPSATLGVAPSAPAVTAAAPAGYLGQIGALGFAMPRNFPYAGLTFSGDAALGLAPINMNGLIYTNRPFQYGTTGERSPTLVNAPIPYSANVLGYGNRLVQDFRNYLLGVEQAIGRDLFVEAVFSHQHIDAINDYSSQNVDNIFIDKNPTLLGLNGSILTNPNYNRYFVINDQPTSYEQRYIDETRRATASYKLDFARYVKNRWGAWLGQHNAAALVERTSADFVQNFAFLRNTNNAALAGTPQFPAAAATNIQSANNMIAAINYLDPARPETWAFPDLYTRYPHLLFDGSPKPAPGANGLAPAWVVNSSTRSLQEIRSRMFVLQDVFLRERLVTTFGWRKDSSETWNPPAAATNAAGGYVKNILDTPVKSVASIRKEGSTRTRGFVAYPLRWLGFSYNESNNFQPAAGSLLDIFGRALPNSDGRGRDYGLRFSVGEGLFTGSLSSFTTTTANLATTQLRSGPAGSIDTGRAAIRSRMASLLPEDPYWFSTNYPWNNNYRNLNDNKSEGYEFSFTANPRRHWRVTGNLSRQRTASSNVGGLEREFLSTARALFAAGGKYSAYANESTGGTTINQWLADIESVLTRAKSLEGRADARQARYTARMSTAYDITEGPLKNAGVGATYQWSKALVVGYPYMPGNPGLFDPNRPYLGSDTHVAGFFASYRFKAFQRYSCRLQLNVENAFNQVGLRPLVKVDRGDGQPVVSRYSVDNPRNMVLSGSIDY